MAITINDTSLSNQLVGSLEQIKFKVTGSEYVLEAPAVEFFNIIFSTLPAAGNSMQYFVNTGFGTITFIAVGGSRTVGTECYIISGTQTRKQWLENTVIPMLREIPVFDDYDFSVSGPSDQLRIATLNPASESIAITHFGYTCINTPGDGSIGEFVTDYKIRAQVLMTSSQNTNTYPIRSPWVYFSPRVIGVDATVEEDISEIVHSLFTGHDVPAETGGGLSVINLSARKFFIKFSEYFDAETPNYNLSTPVCRVVRGGRKLIDQSLSLKTWSSDRFLTNRKDISCDRLQADWLYFGLPAKGESEKLYYRVTIMGRSGTVTVVNHTQIISTLDEGTFYRMIAGYDQLELDSDESDPLWYEIDIIKTDASDTLIQVMVKPIRFYVQEPSDYISGIQYFNSFGFLESMLLDGSALVKREFDRELQIIEKKINAGITDHREVGYAVDVSTTIECTTGPINKSGWLAAGDVLLTEKLYWINILDKNRRYAVQLEKGSTEVSSFSPDGTGFSQIPLKIRMLSERANSNDFKILDAV